MPRDSPTQKSDSEVLNHKRRVHNNLKELQRLQSLPEKSVHPMNLRKTVSFENSFERKTGSSHPDYVDISGRNQLIRAVASDDDEEFGVQLKLCCKVKESINYSDYSKRTALIHGSIVGNNTIVNSLLGNSLVDIDIQDISGFTALMHAAQRGHHLIVDLLLKKKANHQLVDSRGNTAIILAARRNHVDCLEAFAKYVNDPADWVVKGEYGLTAEEWANKNERSEAEEYIKNLTIDFKARKSNNQGPPDCNGNGEKDGSSGSGSSSDGGKDDEASRRNGCSGYCSGSCRKRSHEPDERERSSGRRSPKKQFAFNTAPRRVGSQQVSLDRSVGGGGSGSGGRGRNPVGSGGGSGGVGGGRFASEGVRNFVTPADVEDHYAIGDNREAHVAVIKRIPSNTHRGIDYSMQATESVKRYLLHFLEIHGFNITMLEFETYRELSDFIAEFPNLVHMHGCSAWALGLVDFGVLELSQKLILLEQAQAIDGLPKLLLNHSEAPPLKQYREFDHHQHTLFVYGGCAAPGIWDEMRNHFDIPPPRPEFTLHLGELLRRHRQACRPQEEFIVFDNFLQMKLVFSGN